MKACEALKKILSSVGTRISISAANWIVYDEFDDEWTLYSHKRNTSAGIVEKKTKTLEQMYEYIKGIL